MSKQLPMPTRGPARVVRGSEVLDDEWANVVVCPDEGSNVGREIEVAVAIGGIDETYPDRPTEEANAALIAAAFNAAEEARKMGCDPIGAVEQLPGLLKVFDQMRRSNGTGGYLRCWCDSERGFKHAMPETHARYCANARHVYDAARTRGGGE